MRYFKFLKTPQYVLDKKTKKGSVATVVAITSDLGDKFYNADINCTAIVEQTGRKENVGNGAGRVVAEVQWKAGMRALKVEVPFVFAPGMGEAVITLVANKPAKGKGRPGIVADSLEDLLSPSSTTIVSAISHPISPDGSKPEPLAARRLLLKDGVPLDIWENSGTSIEHLARHIWCV